MHSIVEGTTQCRAQQENLLLSWRFIKISMQPFFETQEQGVIYPRITSNIAIAFCCHNHAIFCWRENPVQGSTGKSSAEWEIYPDLHAAFFETQEKGVTAITLHSKFSDNTMYVQPKRSTASKPEGFTLRKKTTPIPIDVTSHPYTIKITYQKYHTTLWVKIDSNNRSTHVDLPVDQIAFYFSYFAWNCLWWYYSASYI